MLEAKLEKVSLFKNTIDAIRDLVKEVALVCDEDGIRLRAMDAAHVLLIDLKMAKDIFDYYYCDRSVNLGLNLEAVWKALNCSSKLDYEEFTIRYHETDSDTVTMILRDPKKQKVQQTTLNLFTFGGDPIDIPTQEYKVVLEVSSSELAKTCHNVGQFAETIQISATDETISFSGKGEFGKHIVKYESDMDGSHNDSTIVTLSIAEPVNEQFSTNYILQMAKAMKINSRVSISLGENMPVQFEYKIGSNGYLRFYLAPKIKEYMV